MSFVDRAKAKAKQAVGGALGDEQLKREGVKEERAADRRRTPATEGSAQMTIDPVGRGLSESPVGNTVHNLVHTLSVKLDSAHRYGLYQEDAVREGHEDCAQVFADIAEQEREMIDLLVGYLQDRLAGASAAVGAVPAGGATGGLGHEAVPGAGAEEVPPVPGDLEPGPSSEPLEPAVETDVPPTAPERPGVETGLETDVPPTAPGGPGAEPGIEPDVPTAPVGPGAEPGVEPVPPTAPGGPGAEPDVPPTAPGGPGAEPRGPDTPRTR